MNSASVLSHFWRTGKSQAFWTKVYLTLFLAGAPCLRFVGRPHTTRGGLGSGGGNLELGSCRRGKAGLGGWEGPRAQELREQQILGLTQGLNQGSPEFPSLIRIQSAHNRSGPGDGRRGILSSRPHTARQGWVGERNPLRGIPPAGWGQKRFPGFPWGKLLLLPPERHPRPARTRPSRGRAPAYPLPLLEVIGDRV